MGMDDYKRNKAVVNKSVLKASSSVSLIGCSGDNNSKGSINLVDLSDT